MYGREWCSEQQRNTAPRGWPTLPARPQRQPRREAQGTVQGHPRASRRGRIKLVELWWSIAQDPMRRDSDRLEASKLLADRGWGKAPTYVAIEEDDPLGLGDVEAAAEEFRRSILRLAERAPEGTSRSK
jgi:hypothetical protein